MSKLSSVPAQLCTNVTLYVIHDGSKPVDYVLEYDDGTVTVDLTDIVEHLSNDALEQLAVDSAKAALDMGIIGGTTDA